MVKLKLHALYSDLRVVYTLILFISMDNEDTKFDVQTSVAENVEDARCPCRGRTATNCPSKE